MDEVATGWFGEHFVRSLRASHLRVDFTSLHETKKGFTGKFLCSVAFALQVSSAAAVLLMIKPESTKIRARGCISLPGLDPGWSRNRHIATC